MSTLFSSPIPAIQRRVNSNARRLKLSIRHHQVFLTIPPRVSEQKVQAFLKESENWLTQTWSQLYAQSSVGQAPVNGEIVALPLLNQSFEVVLGNKSLNQKLLNQKLLNQNFLNTEKSNQHESHVSNSYQAVHNLSSRLLVPSEQAGKLLKQWVRDQATIHLIQRLNQLAMQHGFEYSACQVRHAKTRWGSCSAQKSISLNAALILMPVTLMDYVILHELCHTRELNHSARFWQEMQKVDVDYMQHRQQLKGFKLPSWWYVS